jgi:3-hydroxy-9,10-secoandrosta-1,3,5(10)-triene-9,17-dione monooxygenase reductase component
LYLLGRAYHQIYHRMKPEIERRTLEDAEYLALTLLGVRDSRSIDELDALVAYTGTRITQRVAERLTELGYVECKASSETGAQRLLLTAAGRRTVVELLAVAEAASTDAEQKLDPSESLVLRQLLAKIVEASNPGIPHPWQS